MVTPQVLFFALLGGMLPAIFWLWFWLREDALHPEPRGLIILTFFGGMMAALVSLPLEKTVAFFALPFEMTILLWAGIEEITKYANAYLTGLNKKSNDEPTDPLIYLITSALGFAALENTLFILRPLIHGNVSEALITGNMRFIGASLLHTASSAMIGLFLALSFYKSKRNQKVHAFCALIIAILLHTLFNLFIIEKNNAFFVFIAVWLAIVFLLISFEKVRTLLPLRLRSSDQ